MGTWTSALRFSLRELMLLCAVVGLALSSYLNYSPLRHTGNQLDLAIHGNGYFCVTDERTTEIVFTRNGRFTVEDGRLAIRSGGTIWPVIPQISVPSDPSAIAISPRGLVMARGENRDRANAMGQMQLALIPHPSQLEQIAPGVYRSTTESGPPLLNLPGSESTGLLCQGALCRATAY